jgi:DNA-binding NtrC family response regulator
MVLMDNKQSLKPAKNAFDTAYIQQVTKANGFKFRRAAEALDIHSSALMNKIKTKGITINKTIEPFNGL